MRFGEIRRRNRAERYGYVYRGKFIGNKDANALAVQNPEVLLNAKRAIRHADGQIEYEAALRASQERGHRENAA